MAPLKTTLIIFFPITFLNKLHFYITKLYNFKKDILLLMNVLQKINIKINPCKIYQFLKNIFIKNI